MYNALSAKEARPGVVSVPLKGSFVLNRFGEKVTKFVLQGFRPLKGVFCFESLQEGNFNVKITRVSVPLKGSFVLNEGPIAETLGAVGFRPLKGVFCFEFYGDLDLRGWSWVLFPSP